MLSCNAHIIFETLTQVVGFTTTIGTHCKNIGVDIKQRWKRHALTKYLLRYKGTLDVLLASWCGPRYFLEPTLLSHFARATKSYTYSPHT